MIDHVKSRNVMSNKSMRQIYMNRKLSEGYPGLEEMGDEYFSESQRKESSIPEIFRCINRLIDLPEGPQGKKTVAVVGCGPNPHSVKDLLTMGYDAIGVEPIAQWVHSGQQLIGDSNSVKQGHAELLPFENNSQCAVLLESVLEHVDSPDKALAEVFRVLVPGGVAYIQTTNRWRFSITGKNDEFSVRFFNWLPEIVKEAYVYYHLHFNPSLAHYTSRPAVHWFSYPDLCKMGRKAGFSQFYSKMDLLEPNDPSVAKGKLRRFFLDKTRYRPWLRSLALTQFGDSIFMLKRMCY